MSVRETQSERCLSGLIILFLLVIGTSTRGNAQQYDYTNTESEPALDATLGSPKSEGPELPTFPEVIAETDTEPETLPEIEAVLETDLPSLEEGKPEEDEAAPDNKVEATPWGDPETDAPIKPKVAEIDATAQAEPESNAASKTLAKLDATATAVKEAAEPVAEVSTQPEPDAQLTTGPKDKKKKKSKKKSGGDPETDASIKPKVAEIDATAQAEPESDPASETPAKLDATATAVKEAAEPVAETSTQPEPDAQLTTRPKDKKKKKSKKKSRGDPETDASIKPKVAEIDATAQAEPESDPASKTLAKLDATAPASTQPEPDAQLTTRPKDKKKKKSKKKSRGDPETDASIKPKVAEIDATAQAEPESDPASKTPAKLDATAPASTQPEPDAQLTTRPKDKKKKKPKKKSGGDPETDASIKPKVAEIDATAQAEPESDPASKTLAKLDATAPASTQPEPDAQLTTGPKDKKQKKSKKKSDKKKKKKKKKKKTTEKAKSIEPTTEIKPTEPQPLEPQPTEPKPVEPQPVDSKPVERKPVERKPVELKPVEPKPVEPKPEKPQIEEKVHKEKVEKKPEEPVTQGPCIDIYTNAQKRQACPGGWKDRVRILNLQVGKLKKDNEKLWMQVTGIHGKIEYSRRMISESHLSTNAWKKRVSFPYATSDEEVKVDVTDCSDALGKGNEKPGVYLLNPNGSPYNVRALCVNGWTVVQRRFDGSEDFNRDFDDYVSGFGNFSGEFFLGLENLFRLADKKAYTLRVDAKGSSGKWYYGVYEDFNLLDETDEYRLSLGNMSSGNYFDGFENGRDQQFSTRDRDNDKWRGGNCAEHYGGGWWSGRCSSNLNQMWCRSGCLRWASKPVVSSIIRIKPSSAVVEEDLSENPNPAGLTLDETPV